MAISINFNNVIYRGRDILLNKKISLLKFHQLMKTLSCSLSNGSCIQMRGNSLHGILYTLSWNLSCFWRKFVRILLFQYECCFEEWNAPCIQTCMKIQVMAEKAVSWNCSQECSTPPMVVFCVWGWGPISNTGLLGPNFQELDLMLNIEVSQSKVSENCQNFLCFWKFQIRYSIGEGGHNSSTQMLWKSATIYMEEGVVALV